MTWHAIERALERYGLDISPLEMSAMTDAVGRGDSVLLERRPDGSEAHLCRSPSTGRVLQVIYMPEAHRIVTVIYADSRRHRGRK
ncbi:hypothetical protein [Paramagnetospirillum magneticum]|uniref:DUF4258 domain-containing protein n=1 Tax=Paramagnetospirillum magneticum (strain ATCC 700264 / AMB-1) TaxID=342108 RepID=Q2W3Q9_PARM1|nr:hypothetical protein [Paramagnetospirillum magneticum]BAE51516.1 hypothetical protein amb2712 [Paramagnetospirillum magneticum AMB-1]